MPTRTLFRMSALAGLASGAAMIVGKILMLLPQDQPGEVADFFSPLLAIGLLVGLYLWQREEAGTAGGIAFVFMFIGLVLVTCLDFFGAFIRLELTETVRDGLLEESPGIAMAVSGVIFLIGVILFGVSLIRSRVYPKAAAVLFIIGLVFVPLTEVVGEGVVVAASIVAGVAIIWLSASLLSQLNALERIETAHHVIV